MVRIVQVRIRKDQYETLESIKKQLCQNAGKRLPIHRALDVLASSKDDVIVMGKNGKKITIKRN